MSDEQQPLLASERNHGQPEPVELAALDHHGHSEQSFPQRELRRLQKRLDKLESLAEQEEMKFSHSIKFNTVPEWSDNYISYSNL